MAAGLALSRCASPYGLIAAHGVVGGACWPSASQRIGLWQVKALARDAFTTQDEADDTQTQVDQGHQPWLADPAAVASAYAQAELGWQDAGVQMIQPGQYQMTDTDSGTKANIVLTQPARAGAGGIWAVTHAGSV